MKMAYDRLFYSRLLYIFFIILLGIQLSLLTCTLKGWTDGWTAGGLVDGPDHNLKMNLNLSKGTDGLLLNLLLS